MKINILKKLALTLMAIFLAYRSYELLNKLFFGVFTQHSLGESAIIAFIINLFVTGIFAFLGFAWPTYLTAPSNYYQTTKPKRLLILYRLLKVEWFKSALMLFFWGHNKNKKKFFNEKKNGLNALIVQTKSAEFGHLASFISITIISSFLLT